jgi:hypothetical protein
MESKCPTMKGRIFVWVLTLFTIAFLAPYVSGRVPAAQAAKQPPGNDELIQELKLRIQKLQALVATLQKRIDELESGFGKGTPCVPGRNSPIPPGAKPFYFNGMRYWWVPLSPDRHTNSEP